MLLLINLYLDMDLQIDTSFLHLNYYYYYYLMLNIYNIKYIKQLVSTTTTYLLYFFIRSNIYHTTTNHTNTKNFDIYRQKGKHYNDKRIFSKRRLLLESTTISLVFSLFLYVDFDKTTNSRVQLDNIILYISIKLIEIDKKNIREKKSVVKN